MKKDLFLVFLMFFIVGLVSSCGGGGGGGDSSAADGVFATSPSNLYQPGYLASYSVTGSSNAGAKFEGTMSMKTENKINIDNKQVTPIKSLFNLKNNAQGVFVSVSSTTFYDENKNPIMMITGDPEKTYLPLSIAIPPQTAKIGEFGPLTSWACEDGTSMSGNWSLEKNEADSSKADVVTMMTSLDEFGEITLYQEMVSTIDKDGIAKTMSIQWDYPETGITVYLKAKKTV